MKYIALILVVLLVSAYTGSCGGGGLTVTVDNVVHTVSWR